jgi:hypothetical protein
VTKSVFFHCLVLALFCAGFVGYVLVSSRQLPERVATHFNIRGEPDDWMHRSTHVAFMIAAGLGLPTILIGLCALSGILPAALVNIPRSAYWLAPERRRETARWLVGHSFWMGYLALAFMGGIQFLVVEANRRAPAQLSTAGILTWAGLFLVATVVWSLVLLRHFRTDEP